MQTGKPASAELLGMQARASAGLSQSQSQSCWVEYYLITSTTPKIPFKKIRDSINKKEKVPLTVRLSALSAV